MSALNKSGTRTTAWRYYVPLLKRPRLWILLGLAALLVLWEVDTRYEGVLYAYTVWLCNEFMSHPVLPGIMGYLACKYLSPKRESLITDRNHKLLDHVDTKKSETNTRELASVESKEISGEIL